MAKLGPIEASTEQKGFGNRVETQWNCVIDPSPYLVPGLKIGLGSISNSSIRSSIAPHLRRHVCACASRWNRDARIPAMATAQNVKQNSVAMLKKHNQILFRPKENFPGVFFDSTRFFARSVSRIKRINVLRVSIFLV